jgi:hypothetical protein
MRCTFKTVFYVNGSKERNSKEYQTQRTLDESYESERQKRIIFDEQLPKWNYVVRCKSA